MEQEGIFPSLFPAARGGHSNIPWHHPELLNPLHPISSLSTQPTGAEQTNLKLASVLGGITRVCFFGVQINLPLPVFRAVLASANKPRARLTCVPQDPHATRYLQGQGLII